MIVVSWMRVSENGNYNDEKRGDQRGAAGMGHGGWG
jgi:hypothetical protein